jgi:hypothetical protein
MKRIAMSRKMKRKAILAPATAALLAAIVPGATAWAATTVQIGPSGKTFASSAVRCAAAAESAYQLAPVIDAGLFNPTSKTRADISLNGALVAKVTSANPAANVWLADGNNTVVVALSKKTADTYTFSVQPGLCALPDTSGNTFSTEGTLEYAASGKSYATVTPGCAMSPTTGLPQPYVNLFDNGNYLLNVSVNGVPLTQLSQTRPHTPVFLGAGVNVISAANGYLSVDYYVRDGGDGTCALP